MKKETIFIIDQDGQQGSLLKYRLSASHFPNIALYQSYEECIYRIQKNGSPDFIITLEKEKNSSSLLDFLHATLSYNPFLKFIVVSTVNDLPFATNLLNSGATDYILQSDYLDTSFKELLKNLNYLISKEQFDFKQSSITKW
jgi:DNA-binding NtrC family response regulator